MYKIQNKIVIRFVEKPLTWRKIFTDILTFLRLNYRVDSVITLYIVVL